MGKQCITYVVQHGAIHDAMHIATGGHFCCWNLNLAAVPVAVFNGCAKDDAIEAGPERCAHAHGAGFAGGVEGVTGKGDAFESLGGQADGAHLGVGAGIEFPRDRVPCSQQ